MVTAALLLPRPPRRITLTSGLTRGGAAVLAILGSTLAIGIAAFGLLIVPIAAAVAFGPALLGAL